MTHGHRRLAPGVAVALAVTAADAASKTWALAHARAWPPPTLLDGAVAFSVTLNRGSAFGLGNDSTVAPLVLGALSVALLGWLAWLAIRLAPTDPYAGLALALAFGGTLGNLIDRAFRSVEVWGEVTRPAVVDFIVIGGIEHARWPAFNLADVAIAIGLPWTALLLLRDVSRRKSASTRAGA